MVNQSSAFVAGGVVPSRMGNSHPSLFPYEPLPCADRELIVTGVFRYANTWPTAIALVADGRVDLDAMVTGTFPLDEVSAALHSTADPDTIKSVVVPSRSA